MDSLSRCARIDIDFDGWPKYLKSVRAIAAPESIFEPVRLCIIFIIYLDFFVDNFFRVLY